MKKPTPTIVVEYDTGEQATVSGEPCDVQKSSHVRRQTSSASATLPNESQAVESTYTVPQTIVSMESSGAPHTNSHQGQPNTGGNQQNVMAYKKTVTVCVLGDTGVGKTSLVENLARTNNPMISKCNPIHGVHPKHGGRLYLTTAVTVQGIWDIRFIDAPVISRFPETSLVDFGYGPGLNIRNADVFLLLYDTTNLKSFNYLRSMRLSMIAGFDNMYDKTAHTEANLQSRIIVVATKSDADRSSQINQWGLHEDPPNITVRKLWKWPHVECSTMTNANTFNLFTQILATAARKQHPGAGIASRTRNKCPVQ